MAGPWEGQNSYFTNSLIATVDIIKGEENKGGNGGIC